MSKAKERAFEVVRGGRFLPTPSVLAFGMDEDPLSDRELGALRWVRDAGYAIAVFTHEPAEPLRAQRTRCPVHGGCGPCRGPCALLRAARRDVGASGGDRRHAEGLRGHDERR